jgi:hypothetical protein
VTHPRYFVAVFGDPQPPNKDLVESGIYHPNSQYAPFPVAPGDIMLLYCTNGYVQHAMEVPGLGVVLDFNNQCVNYRWLPFVDPIPKLTIDQQFDASDLSHFGLIRFDRFWLFEISQSSFSKTVGAANIAWQHL